MMGKVSVKMYSVPSSLQFLQQFYVCIYFLDFFPYAFTNVFHFCFDNATWVFSLNTLLTFVN